MLKWAGLVILVLAGSALLIAAIGLLLPREHVASRSAVVPAPPDAVFALVADPGASAAWRPSLSRLDVLPPLEGRVRWVEVRGGDRITFEIVERRPPERLVTRIADPDLPFGGTWTFELAPEGSGTRVTITERGEIDNPVFRALARFVFGYTGSIDTYLDELRARFARS
jgi:uncharacterized protein YndB with AHSA1/START domain